MLPPRSLVRVLRGPMGHDDGRDDAPGAAPAVLRGVHATGRLSAGALFVASYLAVWALLGVAVYPLYRPHGTLVAGHSRSLLGSTSSHRSNGTSAGTVARACTGFQFGLLCVGSSIGLMLMFVALGVMGVIWMSGSPSSSSPRSSLPPKPPSMCRWGWRSWDWNPDRHRALVGSQTATDGEVCASARQAEPTTGRRGFLTDHRIGTREEWLTARLELLEAEKELTRRSDELARRRQELPWVRIDRSTDSRPTRVPRLADCSEGARSSWSPTYVRARVRGGVSAAPRSLTASTADGRVLRRHGGRAAATARSGGRRRRPAGGAAGGGGRPDRDRDGTAIHWSACPVGSLRARMRADWRRSAGWRRDPHT